MLEFSKSTVPVDKKGGLRPEAESTYIHSNLSRLLLGTIGYISQIFTMQEMTSEQPTNYEAYCEQQK